MDSLNIDNCSKTLVFKIFKPFSINIILNLVKRLQNILINLIWEFLVLLHDCVRNMKNYYSIDRLLKNVNALQVGTVKNYSFT